jgi:ribosomal protein S27E
MHKCPKEEHRDWAPEDYYDIECPGCGEVQEFFKEEEKRKCRKCGQIVNNPKYNKK